MNSLPVLVKKNTLEEDLEIILSERILSACERQGVSCGPQQLLVTFFFWALLAHIRGHHSQSTTEMDFKYKKNITKIVRKTNTPVKYGFLKNRHLDRSANTCCPFTYDLETDFNPNGAHSIPDGVAAIVGSRRRPQDYVVVADADATLVAFPGFVRARQQHQRRSGKI